MRTSEESPLESQDSIEATTLGQLLVQAAARDGDHIVVVTEGERISYSELLENAEIFARGFLALGVERGDHVGIFMPNGLRFLQVLFGASMIGAIVVPIHSRFRTEELRHIVRNGDLRVVCTSGEAIEVDHASRFCEAFPELATVSGSDGFNIVEIPLLRHVVAFDTSTTFESFVDEKQFFSRARSISNGALLECYDLVGRQDVAMILYTSGTTAHPKGCVHTHNGLVRNGMNMGRTRFFLTAEDRFFDPLPMFHVGFLLPMMAVMDAGATLLVMSKMDGGNALDMIERERATWLFPAFPAVANALLDHSTFSSRDLSSVRMTMCTGAEPMLRRLQTSLPSSIQISTYGSTETGGVVVYHLPTDDAKVRSTSCGTPMRGVEIRVDSLQTGVSARPGEIGEIRVRGYSVLEEYYRDGAATRLAIDAQGWLHTGDLGDLDELGRLSFHGRLSDVIKVGGENVSPLEVETIISRHPSVVAVQVVGTPDDRLDEVVAAFVEVRDGSPVSEEEIILFCQGKIASFKIPKLVRFVDEWPMSATKIQKNVLRSRLSEELSNLASTDSHTSTVNDSK